ncbi:10497_t:CDS:2, partial [Funneliformis mosseae]
SPALDIQHKLTFKGEIQLQVKSSEIRKLSHISGENAVSSYRQITENYRKKEEICEKLDNKRKENTSIYDE